MVLKGLPPRTSTVGNYESPLEHLEALI